MRRILENRRAYHEGLELRAVTQSDHWFILPIVFPLPLELTEAYWCHRGSSPDSGSARQLTPAVVLPARTRSTGPHLATLRQCSGMDVNGPLNYGVVNSARAVRGERCGSPRVGWGNGRSLRGRWRRRNTIASRGLRTAAANRRRLLDENHGHGPPAPQLSSRTPVPADSVRSIRSFNTNRVDPPRSKSQTRRSWPPRRANVRR